MKESNNTNTLIWTGTKNGSVGLAPTDVLTAAAMKSNTTRN